MRAGVSEAQSELPSHHMTQPSRSWGRREERGAFLPFLSSSSHPTSSVKSEVLNFPVHYYVLLHIYACLLSLP